MMRILKINVNALFLLHNKAFLNIMILNIFYFTIMISHTTLITFVTFILIQFHSIWALLHFIRSHHRNTKQINKYEWRKGNFNPCQRNDHHNHPTQEEWKPFININQFISNTKWLQKEIYLLFRLILGPHVQ